MTGARVSGSRWVHTSSGEPARRGTAVEAVAHVAVQSQFLGDRDRVGKTFDGAAFGLGRLIGKGG